MVSQKYGISDGINHLPITTMYREMTIRAISKDSRINGYTSSSGHPMLIYGLQMYERQLAGSDLDSDEFAKYIIVTAGATSAIHSFMMYHANIKMFKKVIISGMNYYLFEKCCNIYNFEKKISIDKGKCMPSVGKLCNDIHDNKESIVILTQPSNPSGELYEYKEIRNVIRCIIESNSILLIDICQMDELLGVGHFVNIQKIIVEENAANSVVIVNSFSKTRSLAGARIGYIITQNQNLADFIAYYNEIFYFNHCLGYENGIIIDLLYRTLLRYSGENKNAIVRKFRNLILLTAGVDAYKRDFKDVLTSEYIMEDAKIFKEEILNNYRIIYKNYYLCSNFVEDNAITKLMSGYNFCVKLTKKPEETEEEFAVEIERKIKSRILTQGHFCCPVEKGVDWIWMRISAALPRDIFEQHINLLFEED